MVPAGVVGHVPVLPLDRRLTIPMVHSDDVADAIERVLEGRVPGPFNLAADPPVTTAAIAGVLGARLVHVPAPVLRVALTLAVEGPGGAARPGLARPRLRGAADGHLPGVGRARLGRPGQRGACSRDGLRDARGVHRAPVLRPRSAPGQLAGALRRGRSATASVPEARLGAREIAARGVRPRSRGYGPLMQGPGGATSSDLVLELLRHGYGAVEADRARRGAGPTYATRMMGRRAVVLGTEQAARVFYDESMVERSGAMPASLKNLLFGRGAVHCLDGEPHRRRKDLMRELVGDGVRPGGRGHPATGRGHQRMDRP